ncbi:hypothetical protein BGHDH14_bgh05904 [Blumeria hordei DH14]|uniref:Uncharacterized protein n=1 Tax=Blumeria graminis f. sp. hordei (strain DH14) TaxID=546991 RepID=N1J835_BLUG1|nr:hypothetical protein BGHDH14_bgh05904 [Blumeria hordei DH14]
MPPSSEQDSNVSLNQSKHPINLSRKTKLARVHSHNNTEKKNGASKDFGNKAGTLTVVAKHRIHRNMISPDNPILTLPSQPDSIMTTTSNNRHPPTSLYEVPSSLSIDLEKPMILEGRAKHMSVQSEFSGNLINLDNPPSRPYEGKPINIEWVPRKHADISYEYKSLISPSRNRRKESCVQQNGVPMPSFEDSRPQTPLHETTPGSTRFKIRPALHPFLQSQSYSDAFGTSDPSLNSNQPSGTVPGDGGNHCGFDLLYNDNVVVVGYDGGVMLYNISKKGLSKTYSLEGLRGGVHNAKIIPPTSNDVNPQDFPLIALVIHGPVSSEIEPSEKISNSNDDIDRESSHLDIDLENAGYFQTTVEVYSLSGTQKHIATLLSLPKIHQNIPTSNHISKASGALGALNIQADRGNLVVASGITGEIWIFRYGSYARSSDIKFDCIGKFWTTVHRDVAVDTVSPNGLDDWKPTESQPVRKPFNSPILSLNGRWLAYCPPTPSMQTTLRAVIPGLKQGVKVPGLHTSNPPPLPCVNCNVETPGSGSVVKQIVQIGTQKFIEAGNFLAQQGKQAWTNYRSSSSQSAVGNTINQFSINIGQKPNATHDVSVPTPIVTKNPGLISLLDLETLGQHISTNGVSYHPFTTFRVPHGCSFLSFSPNGLALFTASNKGDIQFVWDLMRIQYAKNSLLTLETLDASSNSPRIREIAQFSRMTVARIVDVSWASPHSELAAMVTEPGTIHILDLPPGAFTWPPSRPKPNIQNLSEGVIDSTSSVSKLTATGVATNAVNSLWTAARPLVSGRRRSSTCLSARTMTSQAGHGTQALAAGISRSVGAATGKMNEIRKSSGTKLHLPRNSSVPTKTCVQVVSIKRKDLVFAISNGTVRQYSTKKRGSHGTSGKKTSVKMYAEYKIPIPGKHCGSSDLAQNLNFEELELTEEDIEEIPWKTKQSYSPNEFFQFTDSFIPQAEIESNSPYQPLHTDKRVELHVYNCPDIFLPSKSISSFEKNDDMKEKKSGPEKAWVFGGPIMTTKVDVGPKFTSIDNPDDLINCYSLPQSTIESVMRTPDNSNESEQILITTRRRRFGIEDPNDECGFFEDDCEMLDFAFQRR